MDNTIDISVVIPVYNVMEYLTACLNSVEAARRDLNIEVILVDDGSTDESGEMAKEFAEDHQGFMYYRKENGGLGSARNYGAKLASGKYLAFVDSDDVIMPDIYTNMFKKAEETGSELTICNVARFNSKSRWASNLHLCLFNNLTTDLTTHITECHNLFFDTTAWNKLILRSFYEKHGFEFPEDHMLFEDIPVTMPMHFLANKVAVLRKVGYLWRVREGATKSITQTNSQLKNLTDRLEVMRRVVDFYRKNTNDLDLLRDLQLKLLNIDMNIYLNLITSMKKKEAEQFMSLMNAFVDDYIDHELISSLSAMKRQKYFYMFSGNLEGIKSVKNYQNNFYFGTPISIKANSYCLELPEDIFTEDEYQAANEYIEYGPTMAIAKIDVEENRIIIGTYLYNPKINMNTRDDLLVDPFLIGNLTNTKVPMAVDYIYDDSVTDKYGDRYNNEKQEMDHYKYTTAGYNIIIDLEKLVSNGISADDYFIDCFYKTRLNHGNKMLRTAYNRYRNKYLNRSIIIGEKVFKIRFDPTQLLYIRVEDLKEPLKYSINTKGLFSTEVPVYLINPTEETLDKETELEGQCSYDLNDLSDGLYKVLDCSERETVSTLQPVKMSFEKIGNKIVSIHNGSDNSILIEKKQMFVVLKSSEMNGAVFSFSFEILTEKKEIKKAEIYIKDSIAGINRGSMFCDLTDTESGFKGSGYLDFDELNDFLYASTRKIYVRYDDQENEILSDAMFEYTMKKGTLTLMIMCDIRNKVKVDIFRNWTDSEYTAEKRRYIRNNKYREFRDFPLQDNIIIFESIWGRKYSDNPKALYEYIDRNHPEYTCVWSFNDERIPINGNGIRVRRGTEEYYRYLATAKYLVNNVNFEDRYVKREGQIEIQTMHGTPYKSLGLDVKSDFPTKKSVWKQVRKNMRWDYMISQGKFSSSMVYRWFKFYRTTLNVGYPRTDSLYTFEEDEKTALKQQLGLPLDKKIILYAPTWRVKNNFELQIDLNNLMKKIGSEYVFVIRIHMLASSGFTLPVSRDDVFDLTTYSNIEDLYQISDIMITDYSSTMFDYALTGKPMIFYTYDRKDYEEQLRGVYFDLDKEAPGKIVYTEEELINSIISIETDTEKYQSRIKHFIDKYLTYERPDSCEKIFQAVFVEAKQSRRAKILDGTERWINKHMPDKISSLFEKVKIHTMCLDVHVGK